MQTLARNLLVTGTRIAIGVVTSAPSAANIAAVCGPAAGTPRVVLVRNETGDQGRQDQPREGALHKAVYAVGRPASCAMPAGGDTWLLPFEKLHDHRGFPRETPHLEQWAMDATGRPLPWVAALAGPAHRSGIG